MSASNSLRSDAFITEIDSTVKEKGDLLDPVRKEHKKIREIVYYFNGKVESLIDKQRNEYIQAYENHMQDVQKELFNLREKVSEIANDDTKSEKMEGLKSDQIRYKDEALELEAYSDSLRKKLKNLMSKIYAVEKSRDWLLKKLRESKRKYNILIKEKAKAYEDADTFNMSVGSMSNESSYSIDVSKHGSRRSARRLSPINSKSSHSINKSVKANVIQPDQSVNFKTNSPVDAVRPLISKPPGSPHSMKSYVQKDDSILEKQASEKLIVLRARRQEISDMLKHCSNSCHKRPWYRVKARSLDKLLRDCQEIMEDPDSFSVNQREVLQLACELAALPNTYKVLLDILYGSSTDNDLNSNEDFVPNSYEAVNSTIGAPSAEHAQEISEFRNKLNSIINQGSLNVEATPLLDQDDRTIRIDESSNLLDGDLMEYLQKELKYKKKK